MSTTSRSEARAVALAVALCFGTAAAPTSAAPDAPRSAPEDALDPLRERFRAGMDRYRAGAYAEAILVWDPIYRELGTEKGYRLAFNLARAYDQLGDEPRAIEHYEAYLSETKQRHEAGETLEPLVLKQEREAEDRLAAPRSTHARIHVVARPRTTAKIDTAAERPAGFVAYVAPGAHVVVFNPGTRDERRVEVEAELGHVVDLTPPEPAPPPAPLAAVAPSPAPPPARFEPARSEPFSKTVLWIAGGMTVASIAIPAAFFAHAKGVQSDYDGARSYDDALRLKGDYDTARSTTYATYAIPIVLAVATASLAAYWLFAKKDTTASRSSALPTARR